MYHRRRYGIQTISSVSIVPVLTGRSIARCSPIPFPRLSFKKTHSQCQRRTHGQMPKGPVITGARPDRLAGDGKLVAYILEESAAKSGGAYRDRTDDLMLAKQPLSQLS
jgi:hypothetical protein